ncbi:DUF4468 domain-containing protein [Flavobacterium alkalisoli]|uniref:DUF4468 domain-containing protein n=1 Tax=Flavobacterium alkalisoli TaxID=2602769 RepID=UPI003A939ED0
MKKHLTLLFVFVCVCLFAQEEKITFRFDADTTKTITFKAPGMDRDQVFDYVFEWSKLYYKPVINKTPVEEDLLNKKLIINGGFFKPFCKISKNFYDKNFFSSEYLLIIECYDQKYVMRFYHKRFVDNSKHLEETQFKLQDFFKHPEVFSEWLENYEYRISDIFNSLDYYMKEGIFLYPDQEKKKP